MESFHNTAFIVILICFICNAHGIQKRQTAKDVELLRNEIFKQSQSQSGITREKSSETKAEIDMIKGKILNSTAPPFEMSPSLTSWLKEGSPANTANTKLGFVLEEAINEPKINVLDDHLKQIVNPNVQSSFQPDLEAIKVLAKLKNSESNINNLYRENLKIKSIKEEADFKIGKDVEQWKTINLENSVVLIGKSNNTLILTAGLYNSYEIVKKFEIKEAKTNSMCLETLNIFDQEHNKIRNILLVGVADNLIWYEIFENDIIELYRWKLLKTIDKLTYFKHDKNDLLMLLQIDELNRAEVEFIEFNFQNQEFWVVQAFKLPHLPQSMAFLDAGKDLIAAFTQESFVAIYRYQNTKFEKGKFAFLKNIDAANVSVINGFRIGGHSYLAIGGDHSQILRYVNGDFHPQTILSQTFGHVEEFLVVPIKIYRDDLVLLVQHSITFRTHSLVVVDALIWNGIAFESALSLPCEIASDPNANGFTCILDYEREEGLLGATYIVDEKNNTFYVVVPRNDADSGLFKMEYEIIEAEDPLMKEIENVKNAIELINGMLDLEMSVKKQVDEALKLSLNTRNHFNFEELDIDKLNAEIVHFDGNVTLESDKIEFLDRSYNREDFIANLEEIERTLYDDEQKVKQIDAHLNSFIRKNRQTQILQENGVTESQIYHLGPYPLNGQFDLKTLRVVPQHDQIRPKRQVDPIEESKIDELRVNDLNVKTINGIAVEDFIFLENGILNVPDKNIIFEESVHADNIIMQNNGKINGIDFKNEVLAIDSPNFPKELTFDKVVTDFLHVNKLNDVPVDISSLENITTDFDEKATLTTREAFMNHNLNIQTINGMNWTELMSNIVLVNRASAVENLTVNGNILFIDYGSEVNAKNLNGLSFPNEYVLRTGPTETLISGKKTFNKLYTNALDTDGTINGIEPSNIITLDQPQEIVGETTFSSLAVMKKLEVHGTVSGQQLDQFLPNPTLEHSREILADCTFNGLIVEGTIKIENSLNGQDIKAVLSDIVYETGNSEEIVITGPKAFKSLEIQNDASILSNYIDNVEIDSIMTTIGDQQVKLNQLYGNIYFSNLRISGLFDGINATELEMNSVRTFGDQYVQTPIAVSNHLSASSIDVKHSVNDVLVSDFYFIDDPINFNSNTKIGMFDLSVNNIKVNNDIVGNGLLANLDLKDFEKNHLSKSLEQNIIYPVKVNKLIVGDMFNAKVINGMVFETFRDYLMNLKDFKKNLLSGKHKLDNLIIDGNVNLRYINDKDFEFIKDHAIWLNRPNNVDAALHFLDATDVYEGLTVQNLMNKKNFSRFLENWISKTENPIVINSDKIVGTSVMVEENMDVEKINNIPYASIFRKEDLIDTKELTILGTVNVNKLNVKNKFNLKTAKDLENVYLYEKGSMTHTINSDVKFVQNVNIRNLNTPFLNKLNVSFWLSDLIRYNDPSIYIKGAKSFRSPVMAENGCYIDTFNELNIQNMMKNIVVMERDKIVNIHSNIQLLDDFYAELVGLKGNLTTDFIDGINLHEWIHNALPTHLDVDYKSTLMTESRFIQASNIRVGTINAIPFNNFFTLHTNQTFDYNIIVEGAVTVKNPMIVNGLVNQINLRTERDNTVMLSDNNQEIFTDIFIEDALVLNSVTANGLINSKTIANIAVLNSSPNFDSSLTFTNLEATSLISDDRISSINFTKWYENALWKKGKEVQNIYGNWRLKTIYLEDNVYGNGLINGQEINEIEKNLNKNVHEIEMALTNYSVEYRSMCEKLQYRADDISKSSIYVLKYFEEAFKIIENGNIFSYFTFRTKKNRNYLLVNTNCTTNIYKWSRSQEQFVKLNNVETGVIYSWNKLEPDNSNDVFIITNSKMSANVPCLYGGTNSWKLVDDNLIHISSISYDTNVLEIFVHPLNSYSFYALDNIDHVTNYNVTGQIVEKWKLPVENSTYSFLSADILGGLNLNNGRKIYSLDSTSIRRRQRSVSSKAPIMTVTRNKAHPNDSPTYTLKKPDFHLYPNSNNTVPLIPSKPVKTTKRIDFMSKVKDAGDVIRRSFNFQTAYLSSNASKIAKVSGSDDKLLFAFKSPNVTALREKMVKNAARTESIRNDKVENEKFMAEKLKELENALKNEIKENVNLEAVTNSPNTDELPTEPNYGITPRIIINDENNDQVEVTSENNKIVLENIFNLEPIVEAVMINGEGVRDTENSIIPEHGQGEIAVLNVGTKKNRKTLYAVSRKRTSVIQGNNVIEIYSDIINEKVFQYIVCTDPSNILALHFRDETLLAFMESRREVKIYIYRGIQGFTLFKSITLPDYAYQMTSVTLPPKIQYKCDHRYLVFHFERELLFMAIKVDGNCGLRHIECDGN